MQTLFGSIFTNILYKQQVYKSLDVLGILTLGQSLEQAPRGTNLKYIRNSHYTGWDAVINSFTTKVYTGCPRRNGQNFGRVFLMLKYTDITQNTYVQSWYGYGDKGQRKVWPFAVPRTVPGSRDVIPIRCALSVLVYSRLKRFPRCDCTCKVLGNPKDNYDVSASVFVVQFNGFMSLTS